MTFEVQIERRAQKQLAKVDEPMRSRLVEALRGLRHDPRPAGAKKLSGREGWRIRVGEFRILYEIYDTKLVVLVVHLGHRREVYR